MRVRLKTKILLIADIALVCLSMLIACLLRFDGKFSEIVTGIGVYFWLVMAIAIVTKIICFYIFKLYSSLWKYAGTYEIICLLESVLFSNAIILSLMFILQFKIPYSIFIINMFTDFSLIGGVRFSYRIYRRLIKGIALNVQGTKRVLIVGGGEAGAIIIKELNLHPEMNIKPVGIIDDDKFKQGKEINGVPVVGRREDIARIVEEKHIDEIIITIPSAGHRIINEIYNECAKTQCKIKILPSVTQLINESVTIQKIRDVKIEDLLGREPLNTDIEEMADYLRDKVVLVTGGGGSIGSELCRQIAGLNPKLLIIVDNYENNAYEIQNELLFKYKDLNLSTVIANIRDKQRMENILKKYKPHVVFHAAAHKHVPLMELNPSEAIKNNVFGTLNLAECASTFGTERFVLISTDKAVNPTNVMGATKRIAEMIIQAMDRYSKTEFVAVRFGNVLGSNGSVIPLFKKQIENGGPVTVTHPEVTRYFMTIPEAVQLVIQAGAMAKGGEIFVLDMGEPVKIYDLAKNLIRLSGLEPDEDIKIEFTGLRPGEKLYEELLLAEEGLKATKHDKIYIAQPVFTDLALLKRELDIIGKMLNSSAEQIKDYLINIVPTYKKAQGS